MGLSTRLMSGLVLNSGSSCTSDPFVNPSNSREMALAESSFAGGGGGGGGGGGAALGLGFSLFGLGDGERLSLASRGRFMKSSRPVCLVSTPKSIPLKKFTDFPFASPSLAPVLVLPSVGGSSHPSPPNRHSARARAIIAPSSIIVNRGHRARSDSRAFASPSLASPRLARRVQPHVLANHSNLSLRIDANVSSDPFVVLAQSSRPIGVVGRALIAPRSPPRRSHARERDAIRTFVDSQSQSRFVPWDDRPRGLVRVVRVRSRCARACVRSRSRSRSRSRRRRRTLPRARLRN